MPSSLPAGKGNALAACRSACRRGQRGAAAVEFALVFPVLFLLVYGVIVYSYIYVIQQSITYAAQEAAEAAVSVDPRSDGAYDYTTRVSEVVRSTAYSALSWLPPDQRARVASSAQDSNIIAELCPAGAVSATTGIACPLDSDAMVVRLNFHVLQDGGGQSGPLFPVLDLFLVGRIPPMPETLTATAIVRI